MATRSVDIVVRAHDEMSAKFRMMAGPMAFGLLAGAAAAAGMAIFRLASRLAYALPNALRSSLAAFGEQELAETKLASVLEATGHAAGLSAEQMKAHGEELSKLTTYTDHAITGMQGILATFKGVKGDTFKEATAAILDMSTVMGRDLQSTALQVGKALNDPVKGLTALRRAGVQFSESQQKVIKDLVKTGQVAEAQRIVLDALTSRFGGAAAAAAQTFTGRMTQLRNAVHEVKERIGGMLAPAVERLANFIKEKVLPIVEKLTRQFIEGCRQMAEGAVYGFTFIETIVGDWKTAFELACDTVGLAVVSFVNTLTYWLTEVAPRYLSWFREHVCSWAKEVADAFSGITLKGITKQLKVSVDLHPDIAKNLKETWAEAKRLFDPENWKAAWTRSLTWLSDRLKTTVAGLPEIPPRIIGGIEAQLAKDIVDLAAKIGGEFNKTLAERLADLAAFMAPLERVRMPAAPAAEEEPEEVAQARGRREREQVREAWFLRGAAEKYDVWAQMFSVQQEQRNIAKAQLKRLEEIAAMRRGMEREALKFAHLEWGGPS